MTTETSLYSLLSNNAGVIAQVGTRIYPDAFPEDVTYPAIVFSRASTEPVNGVSGVSFGADVEMSIGVWAKTRTDADAAAEAVEDSLPTSGFTLTARGGVYDPETGLFATNISVLYFEV